MSIEMITGYFENYGVIAIFVIVFLEYLNLPGFPAGVIMPMAGIWAANGKLSFLATMVITVLAGLSGSWILYFFGRFGGDAFLKAYVKKFPKQQKAIDRNFEMIRKKGCVGIFISKLIPMVRTLISIPAGILHIDFVKYTVSSTLGIFVWNFFFVGAGYVFGEKVFAFFG
ncbi:DedA family protein [Lachnospiraceae bacterium]|nr:DedA family protein [Lachnospiraceae bacterium]